MAPVPQAVLRDPRELGLDRDVEGAHRAARTAAAGEFLDLVGVEQARPAVGAALAAQRSPADVCVQGGGLDAEAAGRVRRAN